MPVTVSYPGVYIEEIPSGVRTITGVATSIAPLSGWAPQGPVGSADPCAELAEYSRQFGGLDSAQLPGIVGFQFFLQRR